MKTYTILGVLVLLTLASSCSAVDDGSTDDPPAERDNNGVWYLKIGAVFKYSKQDLDSNGTVTSTAAVNWTVTGDSVIGGERWYRLSGDPTVYYRNRTRGLYRLLVQGAAGTDTSLYLKYPVSLNERYRSGEDSIAVTQYLPSSLSSDVTIVYAVTRNGVPRTDIRITTHSCPEAVVSYGVTPSGRSYVASRMLLTEATWPVK